MKYFFYIFLFSVGLSTLVAYSIYDKPPVENDFAIIINDKVISTNQLNEKYGSKNSNMDNDEFIESIIMKELLIQEARRTGIDQEESFRKSIQNFYEQALSKILLDRKFNEVKATATKKELDRYMDLQGREVAITIITQNSGKQDNETHLTDIFDNFSNEIKFSVLHLTVGAQTKPLLIYGERNIIRLNSVNDKQKSSFSVIKAEKASELITEHKRERAVQQWMNKLRTESLIKINENKIL